MGNVKPIRISQPAVTIA